MRTVEKEKRYCGNCGSHSPYEYPLKMFCSILYAQSKNPIVDTLSCCGDWSPINQDCYCIRDALKKKNAG